MSLVTASMFLILLFFFAILALMVPKAKGQSNNTNDTACSHVPWTVIRIIEGENLTVTWKRSTLEFTKKFRGYRLFHHAEAIGLMKRWSSCISCNPTGSLKKFCHKAKFTCNTTHISMEIPIQEKDMNYTDCYTLQHVFSWHESDVYDKRRLNVAIEKELDNQVKARADSTSAPTNSVVGSTVSDQNRLPTGIDVSGNQVVTIVVVIAVLAAIIGITGCVVWLYRKGHQDDDGGQAENSSDILLENQ